MSMFALSPCKFLDATISYLKVHKSITTREFLNKNSYRIPSFPRSTSVAKPEITAIQCLCTTRIISFSSLYIVTSLYLIMFCISRSILTSVYSYCVCQFGCILFQVVHIDLRVPHANSCSSNGQKNSKILILVLRARKILILVLRPRCRTPFVRFSGASM